jgi:hypothetical protein
VTALVVTLLGLLLVVGGWLLLRPRSAIPPTT